MRVAETYYKLHINTLKDTRRCKELGWKDLNNAMKLCDLYELMKVQFPSVNDYEDHRLPHFGTITCEKWDPEMIKFLDGTLIDVERCEKLMFN
jgi:hypothetical protein